MYNIQKISIKMQSFSLFYWLKCVLFDISLLIVSFIDAQ